MPDDGGMGIGFEARLFKIAAASGAPGCCKRVDHQATMNMRARMIL